METTCLHPAIDSADAETRVAPTQPAANGPRWGSSDLLRGQRVAVIVHEGVEYRLQLTRQNKLLLTK